MDTDSTSSKKTKKKRLSRKEQKARKKQKRGGLATKAPPPPKESSSTNLKSPPSPPSSDVQTSPTDSTKTTQSKVDLSSYVPTPIPTWEEIKREHTQSLGKWFPNAVVVKSKKEPQQQQPSSSPSTTSNKKVLGGGAAALVLFYQYTKQPWPESRVSLLIAYLHRMASSRHVLGGRIRVAPEGVNATVSSTCLATLQQFARDLQHFDSIFQETHFKYIDNLSADRHFCEFKIYPVKELVFYGIGPQEAPLHNGGEHLAPRDFHAKLVQRNTVVIDVRNHYEAAIGRFDGQEHQSTKSTTKDNADEKEDGTSKNDSQSDDTDKSTAAAGGAPSAATYIDPKMRKSTDFPSWLEQEDTKKQLEGKQVLMFCTGGVRCERASAYLNTKMGSQLNGIYQLQGGIENYLQEYSDGGFWRGKNYVFDKREAISKDNRDGDGGVVRHKKKKKNKQKTKDNDDDDDDLQTKCCICSTPWDRYVGKKKCGTCGVPVLMCDKCMSDKKADKERTIRCDLCIEQNVTVRVNEVEYTNNGVKSKVVHDGAKAEGGGKPTNEGKGIVSSDSSKNRKAAPSVLKWGGGHASLKKDKRRFGNKPCRYGAQCNRPDCFFAHPEGKNSVNE